MCLQVILLSNIFTNYLSVYLSYSKDKEASSGATNAAKVSETAMVESTSEDKLVSINLILLYRPNKDNFERTCVITSSDTCSKFDRYS
jgi:hypothetical protein